MNNNACAFRILLFVLANTLSGCVKESNRVHFSINPEDRKIIIPVQLNDSATANMVFDSGGPGFMFSLDSSFVASHPELLPDVLSDTTSGGSGWSYDSYKELSYKNISYSVKIGNTDITYNIMRIMNWKKAMRNDRMEGIFCIPENDTSLVWELNFEHNYMEIHSAEKFKMPQNTLICPIVYPLSPQMFCIQIPMQIRCISGDTLTTNHIYVIDSALALDVVLISPNELDFFNKQDDAVWSNHYDWYNRYYTVNATLFDGFVADSLRIYTYDKSALPKGSCLIGQNFLKRFNVFFDMENRQVGLQPIDNFKRIFNPKGRRFHYLIEPDAGNKFMITFMADYKQNYYKNAGLKVGDEVVSINGILYKNITFERESEFYKEDTLVFDIIRNRVPMQIIVPVNKNEEQGD